MSREAMQMALQALESDPITHAGLVSRKQAITSLRQALEGVSHLLCTSGEHMSGDHNMHQKARMERDPAGLDQHSPGAKLDAGKIRPTLIFNSMYRALRAVIDVGEYGAKKYTVDGWQFVDAGFLRYTEAMYRHLLAENDTMHDEATDLLHAAHVAWNALARLEILLREIEAGERK